MSVPESARPHLPRVLFLCTGNACRSQMAEGWARHLHGDRLDAGSAGTNPHGVDPRAVRAMAEVGVDISGHTSTALDPAEAASLDLLVTVCDRAHESCPVLPGATRIVHRGFDDPPRLAAEAGAAAGADAGDDSDDAAMEPYRRVRDEIRDFVATLPDLLAAPALANPPAPAPRNATP
jgi:arsenate reductase